MSIDGVQVASGLRVLNQDLNKTMEQEFNPDRIAVPNIPGLGTVKVRWIVKASQAKYTILVESAKGGRVSYTKE